MLNRFRSALALLLAAGLLGSSAFAQNEAAPSTAVTVTVQAGDTAYSLSRLAGLSVEEFLNINRLSSPELKVGQVLVLRQNATHTVQAGETLYGLSKQYGVSVEALRSTNLLPEGSTIVVGQLLQVPSPSAVTAKAPATAPTTAPVTAAAPATIAKPPVDIASFSALGGNWRENAQALMGVPYVWGGTNRTGTDCSGFVLQVFGPLGVKLPRVSADQARAGVAVSLDNLLPGDLVFFDTVGAGKVTHVGIYLGNDTFANANSYKGQVTVDRLRADKYWLSRFTGARRVLPDNIMAMQ